MSLNIIVRKGPRGKASAGEVGEVLMRQAKEEVAREKAGYRERSRKIRKAADDNLKGGKGIRPVAVYDAATYLRHEQERPGCMSDPEYRRDFLKRNPECKRD